MKPSATGREATIVRVDRKGKRLRQRPPRGGGNHKL
jgi:hypothetical protein